MEIAERGDENSQDYILEGRTSGQPWQGALSPDAAPIPGPPMIVVSKTAGAVRTFVGASVPTYFEEVDEDLTAEND